jgi:UDP:flavonoid glycosyltransferase YjiC (YdhE family)
VVRQWCQLAGRAPKPEQIAEAVSNVLTKSSYRENARRLAEAVSKTDPLLTLDQILEHLSERPGR